MNWIIETEQYNITNGPNGGQSITSYKNVL